MAVLPDSEIARELGYEDLEVDPVDLQEQLQPNSLDIRLGNELSFFKIHGNQAIDSKEGIDEVHVNDYNIPDGDSFLIAPEDFVLANTKEYFKIPDYLYAQLNGRSSIARLGIEVHSTGGVVDSGFEGELVLEISNNSPKPIRLYPGMRIAQMIFHELSEPAKFPYSEKTNKYQGQTGVVHSKISDEL